MTTKVTILTIVNHRYKADLFGTNSESFRCNICLIYINMLCGINSIR